MVTMKELNKEIELNTETLDTALEEIVDREEMLCKGYLCGIDITFL